MRQRARKSAQRFTEKEFAEKWIENVEALVSLQKARR
jgi:alpha-1,2-mannosyltransferase